MKNPTPNSPVKISTKNTTLITTSFVVVLTFWIHPSDSSRLIFLHMAAWSSCWLLTSNYFKIKSYNFAVEQDDGVGSDHRETAFVCQKFSEKLFVFITLVLKVVDLLVNDRLIDLGVQHLCLWAFLCVLFSDVIGQTAFCKQFYVLKVLPWIVFEYQFLSQVLLYQCVWRFSI